MSDKTEQIKQLMSEKILILDGAMGTMIQSYKLEEKDYRGEQFIAHSCDLKGNNDLLSITQPNIIKAIHSAYFEAGADIIETNTFNSTAISMADYQMENLVYELNKQGAAIARAVADEFEREDSKPRFVAGVLGPTNRTCSISPDVNNPGYRNISFKELADSYREALKGLIDGKTDIILVETIFDTLNAKAALFAVQDVFNELNVSFPLMISGTITDSSGRTLTGQTTEAFLISLSHFPLLSIGLNCALGAAAMHPYLKTLAKKSEFLVSAHPNAGLPNEFGEYDETPELMSSQIQQFLEDGLINIIGGCCGTTPDHIAAIYELSKKYSPRVLVKER